MINNIMKYPRTHHLPYSLGKSPDDVILVDDVCFWDKQVVYFEKLDGECTPMTRDKVHARSEDSLHKPWQSWVRALHAQIAYQIPQNLQIVGENMFAKHSISYDRLSTYFYVFAVIDLEHKIFLSYHDMKNVCHDLGLEIAPVLYEGTYDKNFKLPLRSSFGDEIEGYVVRNINAFPISDMFKNVGKWVRLNHVQTDERWERNWTPNKLKFF